MNTKDAVSRLFGIAVCLFLSFLFSIISIATNSWSSAISVSLVTYYNSDDTLLWVVGCVVFIVLGMLCLCISAMVLVARFFNHGKGRAILAGVLSVFSGVVFLVALIIFMDQQKPYIVQYGYSFALLWVAIPFALIAGALFFSLKDSKFLM